MADTSDKCSHDLYSHTRYCEGESFAHALCLARGLLYNDSQSSAEPARGTDVTYHTQGFADLGGKGSANEGDDSDRRETHLEINL
ncbi:aldehyde dehydrogenase [Aspergillus luchuensis]|uniref:Aldehyde dehydrogenase n=1 Tax=Aspergillus kawachii TaxID=1069201 RepID=A0A146FW01_ASPKA|nr:aldehyde dehydrogenase [Aspergillus luchuensis]